jgi:hypothetical protein
MKRTVIMAPAAVALALAGCASGRGSTLKQGDCAVLGSDQSIHQVSCNHPPQPDIYYVAQVTSGSCTAASDNEVSQNGQTLCLRQIYDTGGGVAAPPSAAPTQAALPTGAKYLGPITEKDISNWYCYQLGRSVFLRHHNAYGWMCGQQGTTFYDKPVDMNQVCQSLYGTMNGTPVRGVYAPDAVARFKNYSDPNSWACYGHREPMP